MTAQAGSGAGSLSAFNDYRRRPPGDRVLQEIVAVEPFAGQGEEQIAGLSLA